MKKCAAVVLIFILCFGLSACGTASETSQETIEETPNLTAPTGNPGINSGDSGTVWSPEPTGSEALTPKYWSILSFQSSTLRPADSDEKYSFQLLESLTTCPFSMASLETTSLDSKLYAVGDTIDLKFTTYVRTESSYFSHGGTSAEGTVISEANGIITVVATLLVPPSLPVDIQIVYQAEY